jgi:4-hydroxy-2-oxoheptanedioate aldolase
MRPNAVRAALDGNRVALGAFVSMPGLLPAAVLAKSHLDFLVVDVQHEAFTIAQTAEIVAATASSECACLVRVAPGDLQMVEAVLDVGAAGIVAPMVRSAQEAASVAAACRYPPRGTRSVGGSRQTLLRGADYFQTANDDVVCVVQIEDAAGAAVAKKIVATPGVDAVFPGVVDLSQSLGFPADYRLLANPPAEVTAVLGEIAEACRTAGKAQMAIAESPDAISVAVERGTSLLLVGGDVAFLRSAARQRVRMAQGSSGARSTTN